MVDDQTTNYSFELPHVDNSLEEDVTRLRSALNGVDAEIALANAALAAHAAAGDPHAQYLTLAEGDAAYAPLAAIDGNNTAIQQKRLIEDDRAAFTPAAGRLFWVTDTYGLYAGDGSTAGGVRVRANAVEFSGRVVDSAAPGQGDALLWDAGASKWAPKKLSRAYLYFLSGG